VVGDHRVDLERQHELHVLRPVHRPDVDLEAAQHRHERRLHLDGVPRGVLGFDRQPDVAGRARHAVQELLQRQQVTRVLHCRLAV
jgi:hypothetical protein